MNCPICNIALSQTLVSGETIDNCKSCDGTWYDSSELTSILQNVTAIPSERSTMEPLGSINCPKCSVKIEATIYAYDSGIPILKCAECRGVWLVGGQLQRLVNYRNSPHVSDKLGQVIAESYGTSSIFNNFVGLVRSRMLSTVLAVIMLTTIFVVGGGVEGVLRLFALLLIPMACIWYSDEMGSLTGIRMGLVRPAITQTTPGVAVAMAGWLLMFSIFGVVMYLVFSR